MSVTDDNIEDVAPKLNGIKEDTFVFITIRDRWTSILSKIVDHFHCRRRQFMEKYGDDADADVKSIIGELSEMRYRLMTDKPLDNLTDYFDDYQMWNELLESLREKDGEDRVSWYKADWLLVECYLYRRLYGSLYKTKYLQEYDLFADQKNEGFLQHFDQVRDSIVMLNEEVVRIDGVEQKRSSIEILLKMCLWGNRCDLSLSGGVVSVHKHSLEEMRSRDKFILVDNTAKIVELLTTSPKPSGGVRVDIVLDNSGMELLGDIVFAEYLVSANLVDQVVFHGKRIPWFVSDVIRSDWDWTLKTIAEAGELEAAFVKSIQDRMEKGVYRLDFDLFWTSPFPYCDMKSEAPALYQELSKSSLIIFKGDLNYRKLVGDRDWDYETQFETALRGFGPAPLVALRTLKAETVCGLSRSTVDQVLAQYGNSNDWLVTGNYAVVQMHC